MPEVVEVCLNAIYLNHKIQNKFITDFIVTGGRYKKNKLNNLNKLKKCLPLKIKCVNTKGKFMYFNLDDEFYIMNTYGLTGFWSFTKYDHSDIQLKIKNVGTLYFTDQLHYGTISITNDKNNVINKFNKLSPDFLKTNFTCNEFYNRIINYKNKEDTIFQALMKQQNSLGSGLGNYLSAEILYDAKLSPFTKIKNIDKSRSNVLCKSIKKIIKYSYMSADDGYFDKLDDDALNFINKLRKNIKKNPNHKYNFHKTTKISNKKFNFNVYRQNYDPHGNKIKKSKIIKGRTTYWSPKIQK